MWAVSGRSRPSVFFNSAMYAKRGGVGYCHGSAGNKPPDYIEACRAAAVSAIDLSLLFQDILRLLRSALVCAFQSEGECVEVEGHVRSDSGTGVLPYAKERREVMCQLRGEERPHLGEAAGGTYERGRGGGNPP